MQRIIFTIGHSTHTIDKFLELLKSFKVEVLVDVRSYPGSRHMPHFNKERLKPTLEKCGIKYEHIKELGGRRRKIESVDQSLTEGWRHIAFRNYSAYSLTPNYTAGIEKFIDIANKNLACAMCAESVPWKCHRLLLSNSLTFKGFEIRHIIDENKYILHELNKFGAKVKFDGTNVIYPKQD